MASPSHTDNPAPPLFSKTVSAVTQAKAHEPGHRRQHAAAACDEGPVAGTQHHAPRPAAEVVVHDVRVVVDHGIRVGEHVVVHPVLTRGRARVVVGEG